MNKIDKFIAILSELQNESAIIKDLRIKAVVLKTKALSPQKIKYGQLSGSTYINSDAIQITKSELLTAVDKINKEMNIRKDFMSYISEIIKYADKEYQLHLVNIYMVPNWNIIKEAKKYDLDRRELSKQIKIQLEKIINHDKHVWNKLIDYIDLLNDERYIKILKK